MEQLDSPRLVHPAPESAVLMEGELYKWRRSALKSTITRSNWQRRVFRIEVGSSALVYGKGLDSDSAKRLEFAFGGTTEQALAIGRVLAAEPA